MFDPDQHRILVNDANKYIQSLVQEYGSEEHALIELVKAHRLARREAESSTFFF